MNVNDLEEATSNVISDENSIVPEYSSSLSDENDHKRKLHHSDSLYLLRKKVQNDHHNTNEDESQLSSIMESSDQAELCEGV